MLTVSLCGGLSSVALSVGSGQRCVPISKRGSRSVISQRPHEGRISVGVREAWGWRAGWRPAGLSTGIPPLARSDTRLAQSGPLGKASSVKTERNQWQGSRVVIDPRGEPSCGPDFQ